MSDNKSLIYGHEGDPGGEGDPFIGRPIMCNANGALKVEVAGDIPGFDPTSTLITQPKPVTGYTQFANRATGNIGYDYFNNQASPYNNSSEWFFNENCRGAQFFFTVDSGTLTLTIIGRAANSLSKSVDLGTTGAVGPGDYVLTIYPGISEVANEKVSDVVPYNWRAKIEGSGQFDLLANFIL